MCVCMYTGMNHVYADVTSVVVRLSGADARGGTRRPRAALLLNCHIDTVPDSPGEWRVAVPLETACV